MAGNEGMKELVEVINRLQDCFAYTSSSLNLQLPMIAVVGGQSAGKSSVLEAVAGRDFLPRGTGIVTRRPLILQMIPHTEEYVEFLHQPGTKYTDFEAVRKEIQEATDKEAPDKAISSRPINLRLYSPYVLQLTLVDLPGLTKNPVNDQPNNIEQLIRDVILEYIEPENTLILAVTPATEDLANSDALKLARQVDPAGERTIGVLTKLDLMDQGTDAREILENKVIPLRRGYIGVKNRSQADITNAINMKAARDAEDAFFSDNYKNLKDRVGTRVLQRVLNQQLEQHIREKLPGIRSNMIQKKNNLTEQLQILGAFDTKAQSNNALFHQVMVRFANSMKLCLEGFDYNVNINEVQLGAVINETINEEIINGLLNEENLMPTKEETMITIRNLFGVANYISPPQQAFRRMVEHMTKKFQEPIKISVEIIAEHAARAVEKFASQELGPFPKLKQEVLTRVMERLKRNELSCKELLITYIEAECAFMNTNHPMMKRSDALATSDHSGIEEGKMNNSPAGSPARTPRHTIGTQRIHQGYLHFPNYSVFSWKKKRVWFAITPVHLIVYKDIREDTELMRLNNAEIRIGVKNDRKSGLKRFTINRIDGRPFGKGQARDFEAIYDGKEGKEIGEEWESKFQEGGILMENFGSANSIFFDEQFLDVYEDQAKSRYRPRPWSIIQPHKIDFARKFESDKTLNKDADCFLEKILLYMRIVRQTIQDLTPKYIVLKLINKLLVYISEELTAEIQDRTDLDTIMERGGDEEMKMRALLSELQKIEEILKIMDNWPSA
ncbi:unnamed protein product [Darwinula stevensoni]|uniref:dynamin GTPase n=1 Tax=Darwinula stevensoni TaxID=69355 RepID=A0A7R9A4Z2_9CRUS|nr:unnamed protein product [Darwinula stevensoni]CAG0894519.1 unnamed protein product [Darwinula stevensoni]